MKTREEQREERRQYENDVYYEVWRGGGDPDRIDFDRVEDQRQDGAYPEEAASSEIRKQAPRPQIEPENESE
jgi:hypothetical protein